MIKLFVFTLITMSILFACSRGVPADSPASVDSADSTLGAITYRENYQNKDSINIYNADGSLWFWYNGDSVGYGPGANDFHPFVFYPDYFRLFLRVVSIDGNRYEIVANEETGLRKYVILGKSSKVGFMSIYKD